LQLHSTPWYSLVQRSNGYVTVLGCGLSWLLRLPVSISRPYLDEKLRGVSLDRGYILSSPNLQPSALIYSQFHRARSPRIIANSRPSSGICRVHRSLPIDPGQNKQHPIHPPILPGHFGARFDGWILLCCIRKFTLEHLETKILIQSAQGRIVFHVVPSEARTTRLLWVPPRWLTPIFVVCDIGM
jgi:hypothetical protein